MTTETVAATKTPITMDDGRVVEFTPKQKLAKTSTIAEDGTVSGTFDFRSGKTLAFTIPSTLLAKFAAHGMEQKIGDSIAGEKDEDDAFVSMEDLIKRLAAGEWNVGRQAGSFTGTSILIRALFEAKNAQSDEEKGKIKAWLDTKTQAEKLALRRSAVLAPIVERLEAEKAAKAKPSDKPSVDTDALLGELDMSAPAAPVGKKTKASVE